MKSIVGVAAALSAIALLPGCSSQNESASTTSETAPPSPSVISGDVTVFAAASLKSTFTELGTQFEKDNPGTKVTFNFAGSSDLVAQLTQGAAADVFAPADTANMTKAVNAGVTTRHPLDFATNTLTIVTAPGNPKSIEEFADLADPDNQVVVCAPQVPCGSAAEKIEKATGVTLNPVSEESSVTDVLGKVTSGQADAGLVYVTDGRTAGDKVSAIPFPEAGEAVNTYPIAVLEESKNPAAAQKFIDLVTGTQGREVLSKAGFEVP